ncbi:DNRLRE domain-containing protein [Rubritalea spongiae]|uniref:DNRLRE domain-containing protein n=1 Tax=Rubritalea spongiae TaxID=430797 RepID=A0ABW5E890_9BACT
MEKILSTAAALLIANAAHAAVITTYVDTTGIGTASDSDFTIANNAQDTLIDTATLQAGVPGNKTGTARYRSFLQFDLSAVFADPDNVSNATFRIYRTDSNGGAYKWGSATLYALDAAFDPASGSQTDYAQLTGTVIGDILLSTDGTNQWFEVDVTSVVQNWKNDQSTHFGFAIQAAEGSSNTAKLFDSATGTNAPELVVTTAVPEPSATALLGLAGMTLILRRRK